MSDENQIRNSIQTYFDCINESSTDKVHAAFHPNVKITGYLDGNLREMSVADFKNWGQSKYPVVYALLRFLLAALTRRPVNTSTSEIQEDSYNLIT